MHLQGKNLSAKISDTDCNQSVPANVQQCQPLITGKAARQTADVVNLFSSQAHQILTAHPINKERLKQGKIPATGIICRSAGQINSIHNLLNYYKVKTAVISGETTVQGLSKLFDFTMITRPEFTALIDTDLKTKVELALKAMKHHDLVYLHIKGTDICAHDHQAKLKSQFIERIDAALANIDINNTIIAVTGDHSTNSNTGFHCCDPVPSILYSPYGRRDKSMTYSEQECLYGGLGRLSANSFLLSVLDQMDHLHNFKKEDTPYIEPVHVSSKMSSKCHKNAE